MSIDTTQQIFASDGIALRGVLYRDDKAAASPAIVMAHGFSAVAAQLEGQARAFAESGFAAFVFDHPGFGLSEGFPRQEVDPVRQMRAYRNAVSHVRALPQVQPDRVGLWGSSMSGGHVIQVGALDSRVGCVVAQAPFISGWDLMAGRPDGAVIGQMLIADREARALGASPAMIPVVSADGGPCALPGADAYEYFTRTGGPSWRNEVMLSSFEFVWAHEPGSYSPRLAPRPLMLIVAGDDIITPTAHALAAFERAGDPKRLVRIRGGHFAVYDGEGFTMAVSAAMEWFRMHL